MMAKLKCKPTIAWGIKWEMAMILPFSIRKTRKDSIVHMEEKYKSSWKQLRKQGMTAVKLEIREYQGRTKEIRVKDPRQPFPQLTIFDTPKST